MKFKTLMILSLFLVFMGQSCFAMGGEDTTAAVEAKNITIQDNEFLTYTQYMGGAVAAQVYFVTKRVSADNGNDYIDVYIHSIRKNNEKPLPKDYTDFKYKMRISVDSASLINYAGSWLEDAKAENDKGLVGFEYDLNEDTSMLKVSQNFWDGYEEKTTRSRIKVKPGFPIMDIESLLFIGPRFLDIKGSGVVYIVAPSVFKEAIPGVFKIIQEEDIEIEGKTYNTTKVGFKISDVFLGNLLEAYTDEIFFWVDNSASGYIVKVQSPQATNVLINASIFE